ncbi:histone-lysine N-methyltransferase, H3 lysine-79 specific [Trichophyton rubrum D6]|uniref:Histone-lysine N-methyltransferase, H3 lysine-79 specific n=4 Tax=Trichophyton TaxID=5550 RepID=A0A178F6R9_TRIRU|nr:histone-lysine N-methyltransferase, H3 lysine-79 specific [Trichophyton rubrum CBS 118892]EZF25025.1 histone-lysine N-methyltransferase, H3 lysine-79 specific [Trichophyton rubrum MR850]EZF44083.1 histone-lysine N-methyltransferase, H3 lysine-79 specific [Trichophyton rubrum CBS 100081]EZF54710.1 histone-lysine N-methyltransferase, H3 lysine-79 specific [Trichophyton rubrum CBS 288.86]EZF65348.1 histone-lysine N-methyltransferase, H3 lysine-79 specific [Trichophyton rubrum CBS 289.86]EZF759
MGFFDHLQKKGTGVIQAQKAQIRKVECKPPIVRSSSAPSHPVKPPSERAHSESSAKRTVTSPRKSTLSDSTGTVKKKAAVASKSDHLAVNPPRSRSVSRKRSSPAVQQLLSSSDDSETDESLDIRLSKRTKVSASAEPDLKRQLRSEIAFSETAEHSFPMVHALDIASIEKKTPGFSSAFKEPSGCTTIALQYPTYSQRERYQLVIPRENDGFKPLEDIVQVVETVSHNYIPEDEICAFTDDSTGYIRLLRRAIKQESPKDFWNAVKAYNETIGRLRDEGVIAKHLDAMHSLSLPWVERILTQVYSRTVSLRVESLKKYESGTDNVYGELLPRFISDIFQKTHLKSDQVFVDLGSGVGNVVLQASLEVGCESWGCEMMQNACDLARLQQAEFKARCRLWGLSSGKVHLVQGDFLDNERIAKALRRADVVLINNQAFTPETNNRIINLLLDLKEGCQIVSLKSFVPTGHKMQARNLNSPINLLSVERHNYWSDSVSWTNAGGTYFIAKKDSSRLRAFSDSLYN